MSLRSISFITLVVLIPSIGCEPADAAKKLAGCPGACDRLTTDCPESLSMISQSLGGPFGSEDSCETSCFAADLDNSDWGKTVDCGITDAVARAATLDLKCEAFKVCVNREVNAVKLTGCPIACKTIGKCVAEYGVSLHILSGYSFSSAAECQASCEGADWGNSSWGRAAECAAASAIPTGAEACTAYEACVLMTGG